MKGEAKHTATRNTVQRALVLDAVRKLHHHPTSADIYDAVRVEHPSISRATVYRNLNVLADLGELRRVEVPNGADRFDFKTSPHYHVRCSACGRVWDAELPYFEDLADQLAETHGFEVQSHDIMFTGICSECKNSSKSEE